MWHCCRIGKNTSRGSKRTGRGRKFWKTYLDAEKGFYEKILQGVPEKNTVEGFAADFGVDLMTMVGFLDGINDSLKEKNPMDTLEKDTQVNLDYDLELLYKNMVEAKAQWLYTLPQWDGLLTEERRRELYKEQKQSKTVVKGRRSAATTLPLRQRQEVQEVLRPGPVRAPR